MCMYLVTRDDAHFQQATSYDVAYRKQVHQGKSLGLDAANMPKNDDTGLFQSSFIREDETQIFIHEIDR